MTLEELVLHCEKRTGATIGIEAVHPLFGTSGRLNLAPRMHIHNLDYCRFVKRSDGNASCARNKHFGIRIAGYGRRIAGCCPHGLWELMQPVMFRRELAAIVYFGNFRGKQELPKVWPHGIFRGELPPRITPEKIAELREAAGFFRRFLEFELELSASNASSATKKHDAAYYCDKVRRYLELHYRDDVQIADAAQLCRLNQNHLSTLLRRTTGKTFRQLLTEQRLLEADACLKYRGDLSVGDIAQLCGYRDSNYFSVVFQRHRGCPPRQFRRIWKDLDDQNVRKQ